MSLIEQSPVPPPAALQAWTTSGLHRDVRTAHRPRVLLVFHTRLDETGAMLNGIAQYEQSHESWTVFTDDEAQTETDPNWLLKEAWDGVISRHTTPALVQACAEHGIPLVDLNDSPPFVGVPKIRPDNTAIGHLGGEYLLDRGFRRFAFSGFCDAGWARERRSGFVEAVQQRGFDCCLFETPQPATYTPSWHGSEVQAMIAWLSHLPRPLGLMACHDVRAVQVLEAAAAAGLLVPEEIAVLGANNDAVRCELASPPLSSVATNSFLSGWRAAETLACLMRGCRAEVDDERVPPRRIVTRRSTDVLAIADRNVTAAVRYIWRHACDQLTVEEVLPHAAVSRSQLEKKFRQYLGRSPQAEIRRVQVLRVRQLLAETDLPLKKIAELAGFDYVEYMCVLFRRLTGETPGAYRKRTHVNPPEEMPGA